MQAFSRAVRRIIYLVIAVAVLAGAGLFVRDNYGWVFAKTVRGQVVRNERVTNPTAILSGRSTPEMMHSYAILIRSDSGELMNASSEDRQWAVVSPGFCVVAKFYPYPFWELDKGGTYGNARVERVFDCPPELKKELGPGALTPSASAAPAPSRPGGAKE